MIRSEIQKEVELQEKFLDRVISDADKYKLSKELRE